MSTKTSNPRCKINFGNLTFRILTLQTTWFWVFLHDFGTKFKFSFGILILQTTLFTVYLHDLGTKSRFSFRILILQASWFTAYLHDRGTKSRFSFWILILQKKGWNKCLQKPLIHDAKLILEILLFGSWSSKLPSFECFCMICADFQKLTSCGIMGRKFLRQSPIPCENSGFSVLRVGPTRQQTEESVKEYMWNYSSTCLFWSPTDATVAIIMHCSHGQKNYGNMSIEKLSPLSGNK